MMRVVLVRLSALGDLVHTWPLATALRQALPQLHLTWVVEEPFRPMVEGHPAVDCVMTAATGRWRKSPFSRQTRTETASLQMKLREIHPDCALDPQGTLKSAWVTHLSGATDRVGLARPWRRELLARVAYTRCVDGDHDNPHVVASNLAMTRALGIDAGDLQAPDGRWLLGRSASIPETQSAPFSILLPGAGHPSKIMSSTVLGETASGLADRGQPALIAWGPGEKERAEEIVAASGDSSMLAPATTILELAHLLHKAALVVGGDTGPTHLAASLGTPTLGVFVATDWRRNGPLGDKSASMSVAKLASKVRPNRAKALGPGAPTSQEILHRCDELLKS